MSISMRIARIRPAEVRLAEENAAFLRAMGIVTIHLQASPGAGKTSLIQRTAESLSGRLRLAVIQATLSNQSGVTDVHAVDLPVVQVNTGEQPYLDASMVREALEQLPLADVDLILIEEIGTLTLPTEQVLGATLRVAMASLPEGEDCPVHYPGPFARADAIVLNKTDLTAHLGRGHRAVVGLAPRTGPRSAALKGRHLSTAFVPTSKSEWRLRRCRDSSTRLVVPERRVLEKTLPSPSQQHGWLTASDGHPGPKAHPDAEKRPHGKRNVAGRGL
jgi:hydrogenase nickel incorporation protein HypB